jgi:hypothetical protein
LAGRARARSWAGAVIVSNTGDSGWALVPEDGAALLADAAPAPASFPAKLLVLLHDRWQAQPGAALTLLPCELVSCNGDRLREIVVQLARGWNCSPAFVDWLQGQPVWANSLVDRIVSEALDPVGAVAEPYALWAIESQPRLLLPCRHPSIVLTDSLARFERLKLFLLNLGHTLLADLWAKGGFAADMTVVQAMQDSDLRTPLEEAWQQEGCRCSTRQGEEARAYLVELRDRLLNPFPRTASPTSRRTTSRRRRAPGAAGEQARRHAGLDQPRCRRRWPFTEQGASNATHGHGDRHRAEISPNTAPARAVWPAVLAPGRFEHPQLQHSSRAGESAVRLLGVPRHRLRGDMAAIGADADLPLVTFAARASAHLPAARRASTGLDGMCSMSTDHLPAHALIVPYASDNVAVARVSWPRRSGRAAGRLGMPVRAAIAAGHKIALRHRLRRVVLKYGQPIGVARRRSCPRARTCITSSSARRCWGRRRWRTAALPVGEAATSKGMWGEGRVATRNYIGVLTSVNCSATVARAIADHFRRDIHPEALARHPNVDGVVPDAARVRHE